MLSTIVVLGLLSFSDNAALFLSLIKVSEQF